MIYKLEEINSEINKYLPTFPNHNNSKLAEIMQSTGSLGFMSHRQLRHYIGELREVKKTKGTGNKLVIGDLHSPFDLEEYFDFSEYPMDHPLYSAKNKKVIGKFKDENMSKTMDEFIGLRAKMYSYTVQEKNVKRAKGVKRAHVKDKITHEDFRAALLTQKVKMATFKTIRSEKHKLYTIEITKVGLSCYDDKVFLIDGINTRAHGHYKNIMK